MLINSDLENYKNRGKYVHVDLISLTVRTHNIGERYITEKV